MKCYPVNVSTERLKIMTSEADTLRDFFATQCKQIKVQMTSDSIYFITMMTAVLDRGL